MGSYWRGDAAAGRQLDLAGAQHQLFAYPLENLVGAVGDHAGMQGIGAREGQTAGIGNLAGRPVIGMAAGLGNDGARRPDARSGDEAGVDCPFQAEARPAQIADGGEAAHQGLCRLVRGHQVDIADIGARQLLIRHRRHHAVPMIVDQAGHQHPAAAIDDLHGLAGRGAAGINRPDLVAFDDHCQAAAQGGGMSVKDRDIGEGDRLAGRCLRECGQGCDQTRAQRCRGMAQKAPPGEGRKRADSSTTAICNRLVEESPRLPLAQGPMEGEFIACGSRLRAGPALAPAAPHPGQSRCADRNRRADRPG